ncbi:hypothetical protein KM043_004522 [Ampulex compressa]|nr:hypothetical protein KM043_004522 [Ampulex compressa]
MAAQPSKGEAPLDDRQSPVNPFERSGAGVGGSFAELEEAGRRILFYLSPFLPQPERGLFFHGSLEPAGLLVAGERSVGARVILGLKGSVASSGQGWTCNLANVARGRATIGALEMDVEAIVLKLRFCSGDLEFPCRRRELE